MVNDEEVETIASWLLDAGDARKKARSKFVREQSTRSASGGQVGEPIIGSAEALPILCVSDFCERERERERRLWRHWYHAEIASDHAYDYLDGAETQRVDAFWACRALELRSACKNKELGAWALDWAAGSSDWWTTMGKWKLCVRWSDCRGSPNSISLACFKQEE